MGLFLQIIRKVTASVENIWIFPLHIQKVIVDAYVQALDTHIVRSFLLTSPLARRMGMLGRNDDNIDYVQSSRWVVL